MIQGLLRFIGKQSKPTVQDRTKQSRSYRTDGAEKLLVKLTALDPGNGAWASNRYLAGEFGISERTIRRWLAELKDKNLIDVRGRGRGRKIHVLSGAIKPQSSKMKKRETAISTGHDCPEIGRKLASNWPTNGHIYRDMRDDLRDREVKAISLPVDPRVKALDDQIAQWAREEREAKEVKRALSGM